MLKNQGVLLVFSVPGRGKKTENGTLDAHKVDTSQGSRARTLIPTVSKSCHEDLAKRRVELMLSKLIQLYF